MRPWIVVVTTFCVLLSPPGFSAAAPPQPNTNFIELAHRDTYLQYNDCWGYRDANTGREYALLGTTTGTSIWNVTDPFNPYEVGFVGSTGTTPNVWRDIDTYGDNVYVVTEGTGGGLEIIDMSNPEAPDSLGKKHSFTSHTMWIDKAAGVAYCNGTGDANARGFRAYNLAVNPDDPTLLASRATPYYHDTWVGNGVAYGAAINNGGWVDILRVTNLPALSVKGVITYPNGFTHNVWPSDDGQYLFTTDEILGSGTVRVFDVSDTSSAVQVAQFPVYTNTCVHNVYVKNDTAYCAWYEEGVLAFDVTDPTKPVQIGSFDTGPDTVAIGNYAGCWAVYPFLPSGVIISSDILQGMHLTYYADAIGTVSGTVRDAVTSLPIGGVEVRVPDFFNRRVTTDVNGNYSAVFPGGSHEVFASKTGYQTGSANVLIVDGAVTDQDFALAPATGVGDGATPSGLVRLSAPAPNPSRGETTFALDVPRPTRLTLAVFDVSGRLVRTLADGAYPTGRHAVTWDGRDDAGRDVPSGAFFAKLDAGEGVQGSTKILLTR